MKNKKDTINLLFSAFLIIAYVICGYFFSSFATSLPAPMNLIVNALIFVVFGLLVFYATRVGEGKAVKRFSVVTLIVLDIPALYIIVASMATGLPLHDVLASSTQLSAIVILACIALGYGVPYTFLSGFEYVTEEIISDMPPVEGGLADDLKDFSPEAETSYSADDTVDEIIVEQTVIESTDGVEEKTIDDALNENKDN